MNLSEIDFDIEVVEGNVLISINGMYSDSERNEINKHIGQELTLNIKNQKLKL
jgi:hypothetical protein